LIFFFLFFFHISAVRTLVSEAERASTVRWKAEKAVQPHLLESYCMLAVWI